jgi:hypothetical protein
LPHRAVHQPLQPDCAQDRDREGEPQQQPLVLDVVETRQVDHRVMDQRHVQRHGDSEHGERQERRHGPPPAMRDERDHGQQERHAAGVEGALVVVRGTAQYALARATPPVGEQRRAQGARRQDVPYQRIRAAVHSHLPAHRAGGGQLARNQHDGHREGSNSDSACDQAEPSQAHAPRCVGQRRGSHERIQQRAAEDVDLRARMAAREYERRHDRERENLAPPSSPHDPLCQQNEPGEPRRDADVRAVAEPHEVERAHREADRREDPGPEAEAQLAHEQVGAERGGPQLQRCRDAEAEGQRQDPDRQHERSEPSDARVREQRRAGERVGVPRGERAALQHLPADRVPREVARREVAQQRVVVLDPSRRPERTPWRDAEQVRRRAQHVAGQQHRPQIRQDEQGQQAGSGDVRMGAQERTGASPLATVNQVRPLPDEKFRAPPRGADRHAPQRTETPV